MAPLQEPYYFRRAAAKFFSWGEEKAFWTKLATHNGDVEWLVQTVTTGPKHHAAEALQSLAFFARLKPQEVLTTMLEQNCLPVMVNMLATHSSYATKHDILTVVSSLVSLEAFCEEALKERVISTILIGMGQGPRLTIQILGKIILELIQRSGALVEEFVMCDGLEYVVEWAQIGDPVIKRLTAEIMLAVSQEKAEFCALMAVEGCIITLLSALEGGSADCLAPASRTLANLSSIHDVRMIMVGAGATQVMLGVLPNGSEAVTRNIVTAVANMSVIPEARRMIHKSGKVPILVNTLGCDDAKSTSMAACSLANLAMEAEVQDIIKETNAIQKLGALLRSDSRQMAVLALGNMARTEDLATTIFMECAVKPFVDMLWDEAEACREEAVRLLLWLCMHEQAREDAITLGVPERLVELFEDENPDTRRLAVQCLTTIAERIRICFSVFSEEAVVGIVCMLNDGNSPCRDQAAATLQWLLNDTPDIQTLALENNALDKLFCLLDDTLDDGTITVACSHAAICLYHLSVYHNNVLEEIGKLFIIPKMVNIVRGSELEIKRIVMKLIARVAKMPDQCRVITESGCIPHLVDLLSVQDQELREAVLATIASCSGDQRALGCIVEHHIPLKEIRDGGNGKLQKAAMDDTLPHQMGLKIKTCSENSRTENSDAYLRALATWYHLENPDDELSADDLQLAGLMPERLLKALVQKLVDTDGLAGVPKNTCTGAE